MAKKQLVPVTPELMRETQMLQLEIATKIRDAAKQLGLRCYLAYGSLLGAVRHGGFIPWDDDMDFMMPRPDFEKFAAEAGAVLGPNYRVRRDGDADNFRFYMKVEDVRTTLHECMLRGTKYQRGGVNVDIFPVDGVPSDSAAAKKHVARVNELSHQITLTVADFSVFPHIPRWKIWGQKLLRLRSERRMIAKRRALLTRYDYAASESVFICAEPQIFPRALFESSAEYRFEGETFESVADGDQWLTIQFGDYMTPPPEKDRALKCYDALDLHAPYAKGDGR